MRAAAALWGNDLRNVVRDRTAVVLLVMPLVFAAFLRFGLSLAEARVPALAAYRLPVVALFCQIAATFPAMMLAFIMLDEKDEGLFPVFRVLPIAPGELVFLRLAMAGVLAFLSPLLVLASVGGGGPPGSLFARAALCALQAPVVTLAIVSLAANKIEGLAVIKGVFPAVMFPAVSVVVSSPWTRLFAVLPAYWVYQGFAADTPGALAVAAAGAAVLHAVLLALFYRRFRRHVLA